jgi:ubiquinone/menaquinone biosynthesis C-methylase UbiE
MSTDSEVTIREDNPYPVPDNIEEIDRLDLQYYAIKTVCGQHYYASLENPRRVLDVGTGTGTWLKEMAVEFPECEFTGIDLTSAKLKLPLPSNCRFEEANLLEGIPYPDGSFDYIRLLMAAIPKDAWPKYIHECIRLCAPGGWIEFWDIDIQLVNGGPACEKFNEWTAKGMLSRGVDLRIIARLGDLFKDAGMDNVIERKLHMPYGSWGGDVGEIFAKTYEMVYTASKPVFIQACNLTEEEYDTTLQAVLEELKTHNAYIPFHAYIVQKPLN